MSNLKARCLILACGNTLRGDDGIGPFLAAWAEQRFQSQPEIQVITRQQWTPELAEEIAHAESVLFIDCSIESFPGSMRLVSVEPAAATEGLATHYLGAAELLALARDLYDSLPQNALLLTVGAGSTELGEVFSAAVRTAIPAACNQIENTVLSLLKE